MNQRVFKFETAPADKSLPGGEGEPIIRLDRVARLAGQAIVDPNLAGKDGASSLLATLDESALDQSLIQAAHSRNMSDRRSRREVKPAVRSRSEFERVADRVEWGSAGGTTLTGARNARSLFLSDGGSQAVLRLAETGKEERVISDGFLDELFEQKQLGSIDDGMYAMLESL